MSEPFDFTFERVTSKNCKPDRVYVYQRGLKHYVVFTRESISDMAAIDFINEHLHRDEPLGRAGADE